MKKIASFWVLSTLTTAAYADSNLRISNESDASSGCDLAVVGAQTRAPFDDFFSAFRAAVASNKPAAIVPLISFPLRINGKRRAIFVQNASAFSRQYHAIFTKKVRDTVLNQAASALFCNSQGVMYGDGEVWVTLNSASNAERYSVAAINVK